MVIKVVLILAVSALALFVLRQHGTTRGGALVKIGMAAFLVFAAYAVLRPDDVTWIAQRLGVGRGTDLVLYLLVVGFGFFAVSTYLRFKEVETRLAALARRIALDEAFGHDRAQDRAQGSPTVSGPPASDPGSGPAAGVPRG